MKEIGRAGLQDKIVSSIERQGGIARKLNGAFRKGIPDLLIAMLGFHLYLAEVKYIGHKKVFKEWSVPLEPLQREEMKLFNVRHSMNAIALTGVHFDGELRLYMTRNPKETIMPNGSPFAAYERGKGFDMHTLTLRLQGGYSSLCTAINLDTGEL